MRSLVTLAFLSIALVGCGAMSNPVIDPDTGTAKVNPATGEVITVYDETFGVLAGMLGLVTANPLIGTLAGSVGLLLRDKVVGNKKS